MENAVMGVLSGIKHPETRKDIVSSGIVAGVEVRDSRAVVRLVFRRRRDPLAKSIARQVREVIMKQLPQIKDVEVITGEVATEAAADTGEQTGTDKICRTIAVASGKGGVGKSTVTANLAVTLRDMGYKVGILDADIYGPSQPKMFGVEGHEPQAVVREGVNWLLPAEAHGIRLTSIGFFIPQGEALIWRGPMATSALKQLIHQTLWEELDYLLIDLPPGTGDVHLSVVSELRVDGAVIVSTPQQVAVADVRRGIKMFRSKGIEIPVLGMIENMAWFTPAELPQNRYYLFGRGGARELASEQQIDMLGEIPIIQSVMEGAEGGIPVAAGPGRASGYYREIAEKIVEKLPAGC